jgi:lysophospholipase L1-like esterase
MPVSIAPGDTVVFCGDSITDQGVFGPAINGINLLVTPRQSGASRATTRANMARGSSRGVAASVPQQPIKAIISGTPGDTVASIAGNVANRITNHNPDVLVLFVGVNDALTATNLAAFNASYDSILSQVAAFADIPTLVLSIFVIGEQWATPGPVWNNSFDPPPSNPGFTPSIAQYDTEIQTAVADTTLTDCDYLDLRPPTLAYEVANNTPEPGAANGILTTDNVHPTRRGQVFISNLVVAECVVS